MINSFSHPPPRTTWIEVSCTALRNNLAQVRRIASGVPVMAVVKANAYGHGAVAVARILQEAGVHSFAVACLGEALELRAGGIVSPILVLGYTPPWQAPEAAGAQVTLTVFDAETAAGMAAQVAAQVTAQPLVVHVKVNTGMNRLGVQPDDAPALLVYLRTLPTLIVEGIFTHFATSDEVDRSYAELQFSRFSALLQRLEAAGLRPAVAHAANSAALLTMPHTHLDLVRSGIALYGLDPDREQCPLPPGFAPALSWKASVTRVGDLEAGDSVSYGREFVATHRMRVAAIPVGYADGFPRKPHTWGSVLLRGQAAPILGRVCMDQSVVDVTRIEAAGGPVRQGEEVMLLGHQGDACISAEEASARVQTNNYDIVSRILARVPRVMV